MKQCYDIVDALDSARDYVDELEEERDGLLIRVEELEDEVASLEGERDQLRDSVSDLETNSKIGNR